MGLIELEFTNYLCTIVNDVKHWVVTPRRASLGATLYKVASCSVSTSLGVL